MVYRFEGFELDTRVLELRCDGAAVAIEPQVFALLVYLIEHRDRAVTRDDLIEAVWRGRIVSDAAVDSRVRSARQAIGDDGQAQRLIRTLRGQGYRFVGAVEDDAAALLPIESAVDAASVEPAPLPEPGPPRAVDAAGGRPTLAVLPFACIGADERAAGVAMGLPHDLIIALSRLRWLFVISRLSSFQLPAAGLDAIGAAERLGVRYCLTGAVEIAAGRLEIMAELVDTNAGGLIWADRYSASADDVYELRARIANAVVSAMELRIPMREAERAALKAPGSLDAWDSFHLGLRHLYRFNAQDNARALGLFEQAVRLDPNFARAHAGRAFAHFQNAFVHFSSDAGRETHSARDAAETAMALDPLEPFANYALGRAHWLDADLDGARTWLGRCIELNPNHAQGVYASALVDTISGVYDDVGPRIDLARALSPYDPLRYAMLITRCLMVLPSGAYDEAAIWAEQAAREPNAHVLIDLIAAIARELGGARPQAERWMASARRKNAAMTREDFFLSLPFRDPNVRGLLDGALARLGMA